MEELTIGNIKFRTFDLGGHTVARKVWSEYFQQVDAVVYMVDTVDRERFLESKAELDVRLLAAPTANLWLRMCSRTDKSSAVACCSRAASACRGCWGRRG